MAFFKKKRRFHLNSANTSATYKVPLFSILMSKSECMYVLTMYVYTFAFQTQWAKNGKIVQYNAGTSGCTVCLKG